MSAVGTITAERKPSVFDELEGGGACLALQQQLHAAEAALDLTDPGDDAGGIEHVSGRLVGVVALRDGKDEAVAFERRLDGPQGPGSPSGDRGGEAGENDLPAKGQDGQGLSFGHGMALAGAGAAWQRHPDTIRMRPAELCQTDAFAKAPVHDEAGRITCTTHSQGPGAPPGAKSAPCAKLFRPDWRIGCQLVRPGCSECLARCSRFPGASQRVHQTPSPTTPPISGPGMLSYVDRNSVPFRRPHVPDPVDATADTELLARVERALAPQYEVEGELGRGGMGIVYRARDTRLKRTVAVKLLPPELAYRTEIKSRFLREAEMAAQLSHPNIVPIYSVDEKDGLVFFIMACVDGDNLAKQMALRGPLPVAEVRRILREVAGALAFAHARKFIHRDIKPDNILIDKDDGRAIVTDFGIARAVQDGAETRLTATGIAIGTPAYMSPEQCAGDREIDGRADLYALGTLGYQMLAGRLPFEATSTPALLVKQLSEKPLSIVERRPDTPPDLAGIVMRLLEKEPSARFATADELSAALDGRISSGYKAPQRQAAPLVGQSQQPDWVYDGGRAGAGSSAPAPYAGATSDEMARWYSPQVVKFRKGLAPFLTFAGVALVLKIVNVVDLTVVPAFWSIGIAMGYAKLWQAGFDWRDVFKQPRETLLADVDVGEGGGFRCALGSQQAQHRARAASPASAVGKRRLAVLGERPGGDGGRDAAAWHAGLGPAALWYVVRRGARRQRRSG